MLGRKKNGAPDAKYYDTNEMVAKFDTVRQWLLKNCKKVSYLLDCETIFQLVHTTVHPVGTPYQQASVCPDLHHATVSRGKWQHGEHVVPRGRSL